MAGRPYTCPYCSSTDTTWKGYRKLKNGKVRLRWCRKCRRKFTTKKVSVNATPPKEMTVQRATAIMEGEAQ